MRQRARIQGAKADTVTVEVKELEDQLRVLKFKIKILSGEELKAAKTARTRIRQRLKG